MKCRFEPRLSTVDRLAWMKDFKDLAVGVYPALRPRSHRRDQAKFLRRNLQILSKRFGSGLSHLTKGSRSAFGVPLAAWTRILGAAMRTKLTHALDRVAVKGAESRRSLRSAWRAALSTQVAGRCPAFQRTKRTQVYLSLTEPLYQLVPACRHSLIRSVLR